MSDRFHPMNLYINYVVFGLRCNKNADHLFSQYSQEIVKVAAFLRANTNMRGVGKVHRGILLQDEYAKDLIIKPVLHCSFLSFSEDIEIAKSFADINSEISAYVRMERPDSKGYLIEYEPSAMEILFHWTWAEVLQLDKTGMVDMELIRNQKEVMVMQTGKEFPLIPLSF